jgi:hypothetical protein
MRNVKVIVEQVARLWLVLIMGVSMNADAGWLGLGGDSWKEEVLLHDGQTIIVKRSQSYGGRGEIGQNAPIREHTLSFTLPNTSKTIEWKSEYSEDVGRANFNLLALHVLDATPYVVAEPNLCLSYNKWGRPNPPYVLFKYDGKTWLRIQMSELPIEFKTINVSLDIRSRPGQELVAMGKVPYQEIVKRNAHAETPHFKSILREAYPGAGGGCEELIKHKGYWIMPNDPIARGMVDGKTK